MRLRLLPLLGLTAAALLLLAPSPPDDPALATARRLRRDLTVLEAHFEALDRQPTARHLLEARKAWKRVEWLADWLEPDFCRDHLIGPPLPRPERKAATPTALPPEGLQALEELILGSESPPDSIKQLSRRLKSRFGYLRHRLESWQPQTAELFDAARLSLVRTFALGLTGGDSPTTAQPLHEARLSLASMGRFWSDVFSFYAREKRNNIYLKKINQKITGHLKAADRLLAEASFDRLDRLSLLREHLDPLYADLLEVQLALDLETARERATRLPWPWNPESKSLFAANFLDADWYLLESYSDSVAVLGRDLFYENALSEDGSLSCASCHDPARAFTDGRPTSQGRGPLPRNSPTLLHAVYAPRYFYDLRAARLEDQIDHVVASEAEFATDYLRLTARLTRTGNYAERFRRAFPQHTAQPISRTTLTAALAAYVARLRSANSPFDRYARRETDTLDAEARAGFNLFMGKAQCGTCHFAPVFNGSVPPRYDEIESEVLGTPDRPTREGAHLSPDPGRFAGREKERLDFFRGSFRTPTVRNSALTAPYMHNGVFTRLDEVIDFYDAGGGIGWGLEVPNQTLPPESLCLSADEKRQLRIFLESLTDTSAR